MLGLRLTDLADDADVTMNTVRYWEMHATIPTDKQEPAAVQAMREAFARRGVVTFVEPAPGVRFVSPPATAPAAPTIARL
ncbi:MAG: hypothetical protein AB7E81_24205 [Hyphomicrobiaceae bacterium]|jgi:hypothetical protein